MNCIWITKSWKICTKLKDIYKIPSFQNYSDVKTLKVKSNSAQEMIKFNPISHLLVIIVLLNLYNYWPFFYQKFCSLRPCIGVLTLCCQLDRSPVFLTSWTTILSILTLFKEPYFNCHKIEIFCDFLTGWIIYWYCM